MNPLDWLLAAILAFSIVKAFLQGFFREAFSLAGLIIGLFLACWVYRDLSVHLSGLITSPQIAQLAAFLLVLIVTAIVFSLIGKLLHKTVSAIGLGIVDRLGGALFGAVRGCLIGLAILMACTAFLPTSPWIRESIFAPYFLRGAHAVSFVLPQDFKDKLLDGIDRIKHSTPDWIKPHR
jgi:membrane protein required for colicin V production